MSLTYKERRGSLLAGATICVAPAGRLDVMATDPRTGVRFPSVDGVRSSSTTGAAIVADSVEADCPELAAQVRTSTRWRTQYAAHLAESTRASVHASTAVVIAERGLAAAHDRLVVVDADGSERPVASWAATDDRSGPTLGTTVVTGTGTRLDRVEVPYRGRVLSGAALEDQLARWVLRGVVEPGFADAVRHVLDRPELLSMPGHRVVLLGAGAAMGPLEQLTRWGADVVAVDVPLDDVWTRVRATAEAGSGQLTAPVADARRTPGAHLGTDLAALRTWIDGLTGLHVEQVPVLASHAYADGAPHVEINVAADILASDVLAARPDAVLAYLHTPTDSFLAPADAVAHARRQAASLRWNGPAHRAASLLSGRTLFRPAYADDLVDDQGRTWGLSDTLVDVQGPNYALAKRVQRWRAVAATQAGRRVSSTVAPASWTTSVTKNRVLAAVYAGAAPFGVEIFRPETARALLAAKLVADTFRDLPGPGAHPEAVFTDAAHGGLWRQPFEPRSALGMAALVGAPRRVLRRA